ncbi:MAG: methyl-accepting chemotaxis protein, partial [Termitinemataceae bacterium]
MYRTVSLQAKLIISFSFMAGFLVLVSIISFNNLHTAITQYNHIQDLLGSGSTLLEKQIDHLKLRSKVGEFQRDISIRVIQVEKDFERCGLGKWYYSDERKHLEKLVPAITPYLKDLEQPHKELHNNIKKLEQLLQENKRDEAVQYYGTTINQNLAQVLDLLDKTIDTVKNKSIQEKLSLERTLQFTQFISLLLSVVLSIVAILFGVFIGYSITKPFNKATRELSRSSSNLEGAANQIASASQELSSGASELASSVEEITSSMEELQSIIESNTKSVNEAELLM